MDPGELAVGDALNFDEDWRSANIAASGWVDVGAGASPSAGSCFDMLPSFSG